MTHKIFLPLLAVLLSGVAIAEETADETAEQWIAVEVTRPFASPKDIADFQKHIAPKLASVKAGSNEDRIAFAKKLNDLLSEDLTPGQRSLICLTRIELLSLSGVDPADIAKAGDLQLNSMRIPPDTIATAQANVFAHLAGYDPRKHAEGEPHGYSADSVLEAYRRLAVLHQLANQSKEAEATIDRALAWRKEQKNLTGADIDDAVLQLETLRKTIHEFTIKPKAAARAPATRPAGTFFGVPLTRDGKIVFVIDHSGSMIDTFDFVRDEILAAVQSLSEDHRFSMIFFSENVDATFPHSGKFAVPTNQMKWYCQYAINNLRAAGKNDDLLKPFAEALDRAFALKPTMIYFLTDGNFDLKLVAEAARLNADKAVKINTIAFLKITKEAEEALKTIASDSSGVYKYVEAKPLK